MRKTPFWVVWAEDGGVPTVMHDTVQSAEKEAERLARNNKGKAFHVLQSHGACVVDDLQRIDLRPSPDDFDDGIPF
jgi:hypothetical protein